MAELVGHHPGDGLTLNFSLVVDALDGQKDLSQSFGQLQVGRPKSWLRFHYQPVNSMNVCAHDERKAERLFVEPNEGVRLFAFSFSLSTTQQRVR